MAGKAEGLVGDLKDLRVEEILHYVHVSRFSGVFTLGRAQGAGKAVLVFRDGKVIYASTSSSRETVGHILVSKGYLSPRALEDALRLQHASGAERRLGSILQELKAVTVLQVEDAVREQASGVVCEILTWPAGSFRLARMDVARMGEAEVAIPSLSATAALDVEEAMLDALSGRPGGGLSRRDLWELTSDAEAALSHLPLRAGEATGPARPEADHPTLRAILAGVGDIGSPLLVSEITDLILTAAAEAAPRCVLFRVGFGGLHGIGYVCRGRDVEGVGRRVRHLTIPIEEPSLFRSAAADARAFRGRLPRDRRLDELLRKLGGPRPDEMLLFAVGTPEKVSYVLYADDAGTETPIGPTGELERLLAEAAGMIGRKDLQKGP